MQVAQNGAFFSHFADESPGANEFRRLYSKLKNLYGAADMKNFIVTSSMMSEGKSTASALLACTIATGLPLGVVTMSISG